MQSIPMVVDSRPLDWVLYLPLACISPQLLDCFEDVRASGCRECVSFGVSSSIRMHRFLSIIPELAFDCRLPCGPLRHVSCVLSNGYVMYLHAVVAGHVIELRPVDPGHLVCILERFPVYRVL